MVVFINKAWAVLVVLIKHIVGLQMTIFLYHQIYEILSSARLSIANNRPHFTKHRFVLLWRKLVWIPAKQRRYVMFFKFTFQLDFASFFALASEVALFPFPLICAYTWGRSCAEVRAFSCQAHFFINLEVCAESAVFFCAYAEFINEAQQLHRATFKEAVARACPYVAGCVSV